MATATTGFVEDRVKEYSPRVVEKAEAILEENGLKRSGKRIQSTNSTDLFRAITKLSKQKRELKMVRKEWEAADQLIHQNRRQIREMTILDGNLNLEMVRVAGRDVGSSNRLVGLINANRAKLKLVREQGDQRKKHADGKRSELSDAEAHYAEKVIELRSLFQKNLDEVGQTLTKSDVQTAIGVMARNFEVPKEQTAYQVLLTLDKKIKKIEEAIFREAIPMRVEQGSLYVEVVIGNKVVPMVVDSGATLISLPAKTAADLGILVPSDAPRIRLVMANGDSIGGRRVTLKRVRVGNFEATDVEAAVLERSAINAEPLLGMSYLSNFKFEIDASARQLKMLRISAD